MIQKEEVLQALKKVQDPDLGRDIVSLGFVKEVRIEASRVHCVIELTTPACPVKDQLKEEARRCVATLPGVKDVEIIMTSQVRTPMSAPANRLIPRVKNVIAVASGKGGVGKSTVSANLALALARSGAKVGLMDADVYGPSIPTILGITEKPLTAQGQGILPVERYGIKVISMGFFVAANEAVVWRGPMLHKMIQDFLGIVEWGELDYLLVDLPPGTGDIQLSLCQTIPLTGAVIVSTPQEVAWNVAQKAIVMFDKLNTPILGIIENMSHFICGHCGNPEEIFGRGRAKNASQTLEIPFLGEIPLTTTVRRTADEGDPIVHSDPTSQTAADLIRIAENLAAQVSIRSLTPDHKKAPSKVGSAGAASLELEWGDGRKLVYPAKELRALCPCAACMDEHTGQRILDISKIPADLKTVSISTVGRYALHIVWSDGHATGLYGYDYLRKLAERSQAAATR